MNYLTTASHACGAQLQQLPSSSSSARLRRHVRAAVDNRLSENRNELVDDVDR